MRLAWLVYLVATAMAYIAAFYSVVFMSVDFVAVAVVVGGVAWLMRSVLRDRLAILEAESGFLEGEVDFAVGNEVVCEGRTGELVKLLREWEGLERSRGNVGFDPWALQSVRNEIRSAIHGDPALERLLELRD